MYCPHKRMNSKIAEVKVLLGGELHQLDTFDRESTDKLAAGHLQAQIDRFKKLWLVTFLVDPKVQDRFKFSDQEFEVWRALLAEYIEAFVVGRSQGKTVDQARNAVVERMAANELFLRPHGGPKLETLSEPLDVAARRQESDFAAVSLRNGATGIFPSGAQSFWRYVQKPAQ